jgi:NSS family neurotransmitter:Na+ symporter
LLFVLTLVLVGWTMTLDGAWQGIIGTYLKPDWDKINIISHYRDPAVWNVWVAAFGQIFFTLSLGFGIMITYASYLPRKTDIVGNALWTCIINCLYSFIAGFAVFGVVGFMAKANEVGIDQVIKSGPQLAFVVYPEAISQLPFGNQLFGIMFFLVLIMAGLSSGISLVEAFTCALIDKFEWSRRKVVSGLCLLGFLGSIIFTTRAGLLILDIVDHFITSYGLVLGGLLECILVGWLLKAKVARAHVNSSGGVRLSILWDYCIRYITPLILAVILIKSFLNEFHEAYGGYHQDALILFGIDWLMIGVVVAIALTFYPWHPEKLTHEHTPEEEKLLT